MYGKWRSKLLALHHHTLNGSKLLTLQGEEVINDAQTNYFSISLYYQMVQCNLMTCYGWRPASRHLKVNKHTIRQGEQTHGCTLRPRFNQLWTIVKSVTSARSYHQDTVEGNPRLSRSVGQCCTTHLGHKDTAAANRLDLLLSLAGEELGLDDHRLLGKGALAQNLVVTLEQNTSFNTQLNYPDQTLSASAFQYGTLDTWSPTARSHYHP